MTIRELVTRWGFQVNDRPLKGLDRNLERVKANAESIGRTVTRVGLAFTGNALGVGALLRTIGDFEQIEVAFETLIGNAKLAAKTMAQMMIFAAKTPFQFKGLLESSKRLLAFGFTARELIPTMTILGNIASGVGKEKLPNLILALGQVRTAGRLTGMELRQFTEAGVPLIEELAKSLGKPKAEIQAMVHGGQISFDQVYAALKAVTSEGGRFNNLMERQSRTLFGFWSNIKDFVQIIVRDIGKQGLLKESKDFLNRVLQFLQVNRTKIVEATGRAVHMVLMWMKDMVKIAMAGVHVFRGLSQAVGGTENALRLLLKAMALLVGAKLLHALGGMTLGIMGMVRALTLAGNAGLIAQAKILAIPLAVGAAIVAIGLIIEDIVAYFQGRKSITGMIMNDFASLWERLEGFFSGMREKVVEFSKMATKGLIDGLSNLTTDDVKGFAEALFKAMSIALKVATFPIEIGLSIAEGVILGLIEGLREKFPKLASLMGLDAVTMASEEQKKQILGKGRAAADALLKRGAVGGLKFSNKAELLRSLMNMSPEELSAISPQRVPRGGGPTSVQVNSPVTVNVPQGTPPEKVAPAVQKGVKEAFEPMLRETARATGQSVAY